MNLVFEGISFGIKDVCVTVELDINYQGRDLYLSAYFTNWFTLA